MRSKIFQHVAENCVEAPSSKHSKIKSRYYAFFSCSGESYFFGEFVLVKSSPSESCEKYFYATL